MSVYGVHPTRYGNLNNEQLYSMFRESSYSKLDESEKLDLLQETVNRDALERGEIGAPEVRFADLPANESGNTSNGVINVNRNMAVNGVQSIEYDGQTIQHPVRAYNFDTKGDYLETFGSRIPDSDKIVIGNSEAYRRVTFYHNIFAEVMPRGKDGKNLNIQREGHTVEDWNLLKLKNGETVVSLAGEESFLFTMPLYR